MLSWLTDPFSDSITQRALIEIVIVAVACGPLGVWVLLYRQSYAAESISHAMLPGLVIGVLIGIPFILGAIGGVIAGAIAIALVSRNEKIGNDAGVAIAIVALVGLGAALALTPTVPVNLYSLLFGDLLGVSGNDLIVGTALAVGVLLTLLLLHRWLSLAAFDRGVAKSLGVKPGRIELALLLLLGLATAIIAEALGNLLLFAVIIAPGVIASTLTKRLSLALTIAPLMTILSGVIGLLISYHADLAAGASVALSAVAISLLALLKRSPVAQT
jgi:ABC-type Mn2+/Zn2+ transport system permease subunit